MCLRNDIGIAHRGQTDLDSAEVTMHRLQLCDDISVRKYKFGIGGQDVFMKGAAHGCFLQQPAEFLIFGGWRTVGAGGIQNRDTVRGHAEVPDEKGGIPVTLGTGAMDREFYPLWKAGQGIQS